MVRALDMSAVAPTVNAALNLDIAGTQLSIARNAMRITLPLECAATPRRPHRRPHRQDQPALLLLPPAAPPLLRPARLLMCPSQPVARAPNLAAVAPPVNAVLNLNIAGTQMSTARTAPLYTLLLECAATPQRPHRRPHRQAQPAPPPLPPAVPPLLRPAQLLVCLSQPVERALHLAAVAPLVNAALNLNIVETQLSIARTAPLYTLPLECVATPRSLHWQFQPALPLLPPAAPPHLRPTRSLVWSRKFQTLKY